MERAQTRADPIAIHAQAGSRASPRVAPHTVPIGATHAPQGHRTTTEKESGMTTTTIDKTRPKPLVSRAVADIGALFTSPPLAIGDNTRPRQEQR